MRKMLLGLAMFIVSIMGVACQDEQVQVKSGEVGVQTESPEINIPQPTPQSTNVNGEVPLNTPVMVTEGNTDLNGDGTNETIRVWLMKGKEVTYSDPGPLIGTYLKGQFDVVATENDGKEVARLGLNDAFDGEEMIFLKDPPFSIELDDYNGDGHPDFTIGQWAGSNGNNYALITISPNGFHVLEKNIYSADHKASIRYRKISNDAFVNKYYDQQKGSYMDVIHRWKDGAFIADSPVETKEIHSAGVEALEPRAIGKAENGEILVVPVKTEILEQLGAPSCIGNEEDYLIKSDYQVLFKGKDGKEIPIDIPEIKTFINPGNKQIRLPTLKFQQFEAVILVPNYMDCHGITFYLLGITDKGAFPFKFHTNEGTFDEFYYNPNSELMVVNDQLVVLTGTAAGGKEKSERLYFKPDIQSQMMELLKTDL